VNFLADECCDALVVTGLRSDGHDVVYVKEVAPGSDDDAILQMAASQQRLVLTEDKDFGELVVRLKLPAYGVILLRMNPADSATKLARLREVLSTDAARLANSFVVIDEGKSRFRALTSP
jgi:predicted nuclease of predicted toxin-antitoxin system